MCMRVKKAIKKIAALGVGATMLGATVLGAMAADLANYPEPFVDTGLFNGYIVVGDNAAAEDVVGAIDIAAALQYEMKEEVSVAAEGMTPMARVTEGVRIVEGSNELNPRFEFISDVQDTPLDEQDLPTVLREALYSETEGETDNDESYTQELRFLTNTGKVEFVQDDNDGAPVATDYLWFDEKYDMYTYELEFDDPVEYDSSTKALAADDWESSVIEIQGNDYTITDIEFTGTIAQDLDVSEFTLTAGDTVIWLTQDQTITKTVDGVQHEITIVDVSDVDTEDEIACGVSVDGDVVWIDKKDTATINGVSIAVTDAKAINAQLQDVDICELSIGASKIVLKDSDEIEIDGVEIDGSQATFTSTAHASTSTFSKLNLTYRPEDDVYLLQGETWVDPILGNWQVSYGGLSGVYEEITVTASGDDAEVLFVNNDGRQVEIPFHFNDETNDIIMGTDDDEPILQEEAYVDAYVGRSTDANWQPRPDIVLNNTGTDGWADLTTHAARIGAGAAFGNAFYEDVDTINYTAGVTDIEGVMLYVVTSGEEIHLLEIADVDTNDNKTDIRDITYGKTYNDEDWNTPVGTGTIDLGGIGQITMTVSSWTADDGMLIASDIYLADLDTTSPFENGGETLYGAAIRFLPYVVYNTTEYGDLESTAAMGDLRVAVELEEESEDQEDAILNIIQFLVEEDSDDDDIQFSKPRFYYSGDYEVNYTATVTGYTAEALTRWGTSEAATAFQDEDEEEDDIELAMTDYGTRVTYDTDNKDYIKLEYPDQEVYGNVFVSPTGASTTGVSEIGGVSTVTLNRMTVGAAKLASEVGNVAAQHLIVVGGPCANSVAAEVMGQSGDMCADGFEEGKAIIKLYEQGSKVALVVAGYSALDTRRASRVLANYNMYQLSGTEVEVSGTSLEDIKVGMPQ